MKRNIRLAAVALLSAVSLIAVTGTASATTVSSGNCSVTAYAPAAVYVSPSVRIEGRGTASCNYDWRYSMSLMTILQQYSSYFTTWSTKSTSQGPWYGGGGGVVNMSSTATYSCVNGQFRTVAQVEVKDIYGNVVFRTTPAYSATFTKSNC